MINTRGHWTGRLMNIKHTYAGDPLGRWTVIHMKGKGDTIVSIFSIYGVCNNIDGSNTAYVQQQNDLYDKHKQILDPRMQIIKDIQPVLAQLVEKGHKIIVDADINDDAGCEFDNRWNSMMQELGLRNIIQSQHHNKPLQSTYDRGKRCLDVIAVSGNIESKHILKCGILPF